MCTMFRLARKIQEYRDISKIHVLQMQQYYLIVGALSEAHNITSILVLQLEVIRFFSSMGLRLDQNFFILVLSPLRDV